MSPVRCSSDGLPADGHGPWLYAGGIAGSGAWAKQSHRWPPWIGERVRLAGLDFGVWGGPDGRGVQP